MDSSTSSSSFVSRPQAVAADLLRDVFGAAHEEVLGQPLLADGRLLPDPGGERDFVRLASVTLLQIGTSPAEPLQTFRDGRVVAKDMRELDSMIFPVVIDQKLSLGNPAVRQTGRQHGATNDVPEAIWKFAYQVGAAGAGAAKPDQAHEKPCDADF